MIKVLVIIVYEISSPKDVPRCDKYPLERKTVLLDKGSSLGYGSGNVYHLHLFVSR